MLGPTEDSFIYLFSHPFIFRSTFSLPGTEQIHKTLSKRNKLSFGHNVRMDPNVGNAYVNYSIPHLASVIRVNPEAVTSILALD